MGALALHIRGVKRRFGRLQVLRGVDLELAAGQVSGLLGPNGAGKTTLLAVVAGLIRAHSGDVEVYGEPLLRNRARCSKLIGFVSHEGFVYESLTPFENICFFGSLFELSKPRVRAQTALERAELPAEKWHVPVNELSRGLKQRVALARAVVHEPKLLVLDEPYSGLDPAAAATLTALVRAHREQGGSALVTTHNLTRAREVADDLAILVRGRVAWRRPSDALSAEELDRSYSETVGADG